MALVLRFLRAAATFLLYVVAFLVLPPLVHFAVRCVDAVQDTLSRLARSRFDAVSWRVIVLGVVVLCAWHVVLARLSYHAVLESGAEPAHAEREKQRGPTTDKAPKASAPWPRILARVLVPGFLVASIALWTVRFAAALLAPVYMNENPVGDIDG